MIAKEESAGLAAADVGGNARSNMVELRASLRELIRLADIDDDGGKSIECYILEDVSQLDLSSSPKLCRAFEK